MNDTIKQWQYIKDLVASSRVEGGIDWWVERSDAEWAEIAKEFDKYIERSK